MSLETIRAEHIRGALLGLLIHGTWASDAVLHDAVNAVKFVTADRDQVREAIRWLAERDLVVLQEIDIGPAQRSVLRAKIAERGRDFEASRTFVEGIRRRSDG